MIHTDRKIRHDDKVAFTPFLKPSDFDINSPEVKKIPETAISALLDSMDTLSVWCGLVFSPEDLDFARYFYFMYYVEESQKSVPNSHLDPKTRCSSSFNRHDVEVLAVSICNAYKSKFSLAAHSLLLTGSQEGKVSNPEARKQGLAQLAEAVTARPLDVTKLAQVRGRIEAEFGREFLVEACGVAGAMELLTKVDDATGKTPLPSSVRHIGKGVMFLRKLVAS
eukprot:CAMPEP_0116578060 /NCGR_PEP_ID=MMETSP0397-20121206/21486_1 /TAXON_ID=216820 /ORGANISM="Cyclophora tenuis, Strain ECT3854" /LENGTH=222 /DNA_ID=CAMNT_0004107387 /DNA_START=172 /DNA_END=840 /DNA_ORIENTATION=-